MFVVAYSPPGDADPAHRRGMFVTVFRDGYDARQWRYLESTLLPP